MARKSIENIKKKQIDILQSIKVLTKWINNPRRTDNQLIEIIDKYKIKNSVIRRILSYNFGFPYIIKYFNKYLNSLYQFDNYDTRLLIKSLTYVMDVNNRCNSKNFMFIKSSDLKDQIKKVVKDLIKDYMFTVHNIVCNGRDLDIYYRLIKLGIIKDEDLLEIDRLMNGDKPVITSLDFINYGDTVKTQELSEEQIENLTLDSPNFSDEILEIINYTKNMKNNSDVCKKCPLFNKTMVTIDTNLNKPGEVDITFIGLNPGREEAEKERPFVGDSGKYIRTLISQLPRKMTWVIYNVILCSTSNKNEITAAGSVNDIIRNCLNITSKIFEKFPSKIYIPIGDDAKSIFGITDRISAASGKIYDVGKDSKIIPLIHPSAILRNGRNKAIYDQSVKKILEFVNPNIDIKQINTKAVEIESTNIVEDEKGLLLLDIKKLENNQVLMIYTDLAGKKKYIIKKFSFPVLIRNKEWKECDMITEKTQDTCFLNDYQKSNLSKKCHQILNQMVNI
jgi:uracil-DNA glycosylase family 4